MGPDGPLLTSVRVALRLGRVSNLPTVWSNAAAGAALAGSSLEPPATLVGVMLSLSLSYVGGMYLNDAFDRHIDARERPGRPIPAGLVPASGVFAAGFALLAAGLLLLAGASAAALAAGTLLAACIVVYDMHHKGNPFGPLIMAACRALSYAVAALAMTGRLEAAVAVGGLALACHVVGLSHIARFESLNQNGARLPLATLAVPPLLAFWLLPAAWPATLGLLAWDAYCLGFVVVPGRRDVKRGVSGLIAGISLLDAAILAGLGPPLPALAAAVAFLLTLALQRVVPGT